MKKYLIFLSALCSMYTFAQEAVEPILLSTYYAQKVTPDGKYVVAQDFTASAILYDVQNHEEFWYGGIYPGNGNCVSLSGIIVGQDMASSRGVVMMNGEATIPRVLNVELQSTIDAITPDGSRVCGWVQNRNVGLFQIPYYCDVDENGTLGSPQALPYPEKDFFGDTPQFCTATYISDDGKTIAGILTDGSGFYSYPIVYLQDESGAWSYVCPSEPLFNPEHLPVPHFPDPDELDLPKQPRITDYMTEEKKAEWEQAMKEYEETGDPSLDPWWNVEYFTGDEGYEKYDEAVIAYNREVNRLYDESIDKYWMEMAQIGKNARFLPNAALSPDGKTLAMDLGVSDDEFASDYSSAYVTYVFNLEEGTYEEIKSQYENLIPTQILEDGTLVSLGAPETPLEYNAYIMLPDTDEYISFEEYIADTNPQYVSWMEEYLDFFNTGIISGQVSFSSDRSVIVGGIPLDDMVSYIITSANAGVDEIVVPEAEYYKVYNLSGINVLSTKDKSALNDLPEGIYIINGKKIKL